MDLRKALYKKIDKPAYNKSLGRVNNTQLKHQVIERVEKSINNSKAIAEFFRGDTDEQTAFNVWTFLRNHIQYKLDPKKKQGIKLPSGLLRVGYGDCKSFSLFATSILENLGIPAGLRFVSYDQYDKRPSHVFSFYYDRQKKNSFRLTELINTLMKRNHLNTSKII